MSRYAPVTPTGDSLRDALKTTRRAPRSHKHSALRKRNDRRNWRWDDVTEPEACVVKARTDQTDCGVALVEHECTRSISVRCLVGKVPQWTRSESMFRKETFIRPDEVLEKPRVHRTARLHGSDGCLLGGVGQSALRERSAARGHSAANARRTVRLKPPKRGHPGRTPRIGSSSSSRFKVSARPRRISLVSEA